MSGFINRYLCPNPRWSQAVTQQHPLFLMYSNACLFVNQGQSHPNELLFIRMMGKRRNRLMRANVKNRLLAFGVWNSHLPRGQINPAISQLNGLDDITCRSSILYVEKLPQQFFRSRPTCVKCFFPPSISYSLCYSISFLGINWLFDSWRREINFACRHSKGGKILILLSEQADSVFVAGGYCK